MTPQWKPDNPGRRGIEWCDLTWPVLGGCFHECKWKMPDGKIAICYAKSVAENGPAAAAYQQGFEHAYWRPKNLEAPYHLKEPSLIFADSMADWMGHWVTEEQIQALLKTVWGNPQHTFIILTKAAPRLLKFMREFPQNLWVLVSSPPDFMNSKTLNQEQQTVMLTKQLDVLRQVSNYIPVVGMSIEPLSWDISPYLEDSPLKWAIIGAASNGRQKFQPEREHVQRLLTIFDHNDTPVFFKGNLEWSPRREDFPTQNEAVLRRQRNALQFGWTLNRHLQRSALSCI